MNSTGKSRRDSGPDATSAAASPSINLDQITSDQYAQAYLDHLFSDKGPVAELENYFIKASANLRTLRTQPGCKDKTGLRNGLEQSDGVRLKERADGSHGEQRADSGKGDEQGETERRGRGEETEECERRDESLKLSIVETHPDESLAHSLHAATST